MPPISVPIDIPNIAGECRLPRRRSRPTNPPIVPAAALTATRITGTPSTSSSPARVDHASTGAIRTTAAYMNEANDPIRLAMIATRTPAPMRHVHHEVTAAARK